MDVDWNVNELKAGLKIVVTEYIENKPFDEIKINDTASLTRMLKQQDIELFAVMSGDVNPAHVDLEYAKSDIFHKVIAHGMWSGALLSTVLGTELPGPGAILLKQTLTFEHPVTLGDIVTFSVKVINKNVDNHRVELECKAVNQNGKTVISGLATVVAPIEKIKRKRFDLPKVLLTRDKDNWYNFLISLKKDQPPLVTAVVHPVDEASLKGAIASAQENLIKPILVGPEDKIRKVAKENNIDLSPYEIVTTRHSQEAAELAVQMARNGGVEALMKGKIHTDELMEAVVSKEYGLRTGRRMSHIFAMEVPYYSKPLFITDAALNIRPNLFEKRDIIQNAIDLFCSLNLSVPKVAIVSAVETVNEKIPSTLDATALCKMSERGQITGGILDGPLGFDLAISPKAAKIKDLNSMVAGDADIIIVPDVESGNILYKQMTYLSGVEAAGIVIGATVPIILTSRGSDELSRKASCAMALLYGRRKPS